MEHKCKDDNIETSYRVGYSDNHKSCRIMSGSSDKKS